MKKELHDEITILHLSDLHFNKGNELEINEILNELLKDLGKLKEEYDLKPTFIFISGDIANSGDPLDYNIALSWLNKFSKDLEIPREQFFIIPGNHDVNRNELREISELNLKDEDHITKFLTTESERIPVFKKLDNFYDFINNFYGVEKNPYKEKYFFAKKIIIGEYNIGIVGLNSTWFSGENRFENGTIIIDKKELIVGSHQAKSAYELLSEVDICFTLMHHPFSQLNDFEEGTIKRIVMEKSNIIFHGHTHSTSIAEIIGPDAGCVILCAGASYLKKYNKCYSVCKISLKDFSYNIYLRRFSEENRFWAKDTLTYRAGEGILTGKFLSTGSCLTDSLSRTYPFEKPLLEIEEFVKYNWKKLFFEKDVDKDQIIELRRKFFHKLNLNPPIHDIVLGAIQYLLENKIISDNHELTSIIKNSKLINEYLSGFEKQRILDYFDENYFKEQNKEIVFKSAEEIAKLKQSEFLAKKTKEFGQKIEEKLKKKYDEKEEELKRRKEQIEKEYESFISKIDNYTDLKDEDLPKIQKPTPILRDIWYKELGLTEDPFPSHVELEGFNETLYDKIIVKTEIFHKFDHQIKEMPKTMHRRNYLIYGTMGSGKTTLFRYLDKTISILKPNVFPILIALEAQPNYENIRFDFYNKLYEKLELKYFSLTKIPLGIEKSIISDTTISYIFKQIMNLSEIDEFIIFIDDLHKHPRNAHEAFEFISGLQIFRSQMHGNGINLSMFLSGDLNWLSDTDGIKAIGGSIDVKEKIPEISVDDAVNMINRRLKVFAVNPNKPPTIKKEYVETIFKMIKSRFPTEVTFRDIVEDMQKHLSNHEFDSLVLNIILDVNTISNMLLDMETDHPWIKSKINDIWIYSDRDEIIFSEFMQILNNLYLEGGISEDHHQFTDKIDYYGRLFRVGLISQQRREDSFVWVLTKDLRNMFVKFENKYGFKPSEYLSKLLIAEEGTGKKYISEESSRLSTILKTGGAYGESFLNYIKEALETYRILFNYSVSLQETETPIEILKLCKKSCISLMNATLIVCENKQKNSESVSTVHEEFVDNWYSNPDLTELIDTIQTKENKETPLDSYDIKEICRNYFRAVKTLVSNIIKFMKYNTVFTLDSKFVHIADKKILNDVRRNFYTENYDLALDKINSLLKSKLIEIIYSVNCLMYGSQKWKRGLPPSINEKLKVAIDIDSNEKSLLQNLTLSDFSEICLNFDKISDTLFTSLFEGGSWETVKKTLFLEAELMEIEKGTEINRKKNDLLEYVSQSKILIEKIDSFYFMLFSDRIPFLMNFRKFKISLDESDKRLVKYDIQKELVDKIHLKIKNEGHIELDFSRFIPQATFHNLNFVDWIFYIYHLRFNLNIISITIDPNGRIIIT